MPINFGKLTSSNASNTVVPPREIFTALPKKKEGLFQYPRDVQSQVWDAWFLRREEKDLIIKMNTGSGKTVVGLLILKSCLNEGKSPAVYIVPDNYLVKQVIGEAENLGIEITEDVNSPLFLSGKAILVVNIHKLVNGLSVFGVGDEGARIKIGSLIVDDAHACLDTIEDQFTLSVKSSSPAYSKIYTCLESSLHEQCASKALEIKAGDRNAYMQVPFWIWHKELDNIVKILIENKTQDDNIRFAWPLIKESIKLSRCVVTAQEIEISPHCIPISVMPSISSAARKIFMTATLVDDSILASHFGITGNSINKPVIPDSAGDIGDRMILLPQVINSEFTDDNIKKFCKEISQDVNVVVIVPSQNRANYWKDCADMILKKDNLHAGVKRLKSEKIGLTILVNRYDGIDLPKNACRLLVIDGLPDVRRQIDKIDQTLLLGSPRIASQLVQRIEQGMGRGVRSSDDHCVVFLMGRNLTSQLYADGAMDRFSPATKAQIDLSNLVAGQIDGADISSLRETIMYCLHRDQEWVSASKGVLTSLSYIEETTPELAAIAQRKAYDYALVNDCNAAVEELDSAIKATQDVVLKSYLQYFLAEYLDLYNPVDAQKVLLAAASQNPRMIKPISGISYHRIGSLAYDQAKSCGDYLRGNFLDPNNLLIKVQAVASNLIFQPDTASVFEESIREVARYIGFNSQRPELFYGKGPDVLWEIGNLSYFVIECKNGSVQQTICKKDCNQLNGSGEWFIERYDQTCKFTPILIHPSYTFEHAATPKSETRIIDAKGLALFVQNVQTFIRALCATNRIHDDDFIKQNLISCNLTSDRFISVYTSRYSVKR